MSARGMDALRARKLRVFFFVVRSGRRLQWSQRAPSCAVRSQLRLLRTLCCVSEAAAFCRLRGHR